MTLTAMNNTTFSVSEFILHCPINYEQRDFVILTFFFIFLVSFSGNFLVLLAISLNHELHKPMYLYIGTLAIFDLINSANLIPKMMAVLLDATSIPYGPCVLQMYIVYHLEVAESLIFVFMACDRYIAVLHPFHYPTLVTNKIVFFTIFLSNFISAMVITPYVVYVTEVHFCVTNVLPYCFCDYATMIHVSCGRDPKYFSTLSITACVFCFGPISLILFSYVSIAHAALKIKSSEGKNKALSTSLTHLLVMALFYLPIIICYILPGFGVQLPQELYNALVIITNIVPPMLNPIIYSFRNTNIKNAIYKLFKLKKISPAVN